MLTRIKKKSPKCKKLTTTLWEQIQGIRILIEKDNKQYYQAKCSECSWYWEIKK